MKLRNLIRLVGFSGLLAVVLAGHTPAADATPSVNIGAGIVHGTVNSSGISITPAPTSFAFVNPTIVIADAGVGDDQGPGTSGDSAGVFAGPVSVPTISGQSTGNEDITGGSGTINGFGFSGDVRVSGTGATTSGTISGGTYARVGGVVVVTLTCTIWEEINYVAGIEITSHHEMHSGGTIAVVGTFTPTQGDGITAPVTQAIFDGTIGGFQGGL